MIREYIIKVDESKPDIIGGLPLTEQAKELVRCKNCVHNGKVEKCVLAAIAAEKGFPLFMLDNCGKWFCADGKRKGTGMTNEDAIKWLENLRQDIGQLRHEDLWHYEQAIVEIIELLEDLEKKYNSLLNEKISELIEENAKLNLEMNQAISEQSIHTMGKVGEVDERSKQNR